MLAEIGYALALRIPVLPICIGVDPPGIIQEVQAVKFLSHPNDSGAFAAEATSKISAKTLEPSLKEARKFNPLFECAEDNSCRATMLARYAEAVTSIGRHGIVRQKASLGTFSIPSVAPKSSVWKSAFGQDYQDARYLYESHKAERDALYIHAQKAGCKLVIDPGELLPAIFSRFGPESVPTRIRVLIEFLSDPSVKKIDVALNHDMNRKASMTIVGDWFSSEAISTKEVANLRQGVFTRHFPQVRRQIEEFDEEFALLQTACKWSFGDSREHAIDYLTGLLHGPQ